jgi:hypothetical protein
MLKKILITLCLAGVSIAVTPVVSANSNIAANQAVIQLADTDAAAASGGDDTTDNTLSDSSSSDDDGMANDDSSAEATMDDGSDSSASK